MKYNNFLILIIIFSLIIPIAFSAPIANWYAVQDWELDVCNKWGGTVTDGTVSGRFRAQTDIIQSTTVTLQAHKIVGPQNATYEIAWYVEPAMNAMAISIYLKGTQNFLVANGTADFRAPSVGYWAGDLPANYSEAIIQFSGETLSVPVVCINCD
ncbi:hypothetical protein KY335_01240 [Candidatus Woesearchaeota archaeon]|nr:hypothetical protein [Candidatus Woesearchaeota archaeon]